jgi:predicted SAM-dependent methyltransferase
VKIHIGGEQPKEGWKILNIQGKKGADFIGSISDLTRFENNSIDEIYASHVLEHVQQNRVLDTLKGVYRVLRAGGKFYISVPDLDVLCHTFINPLANQDVKIHVMRMIFGGQIDEHDFHFFGWNQLFLSDFLGRAGFSEAHRVETFGIFEDTSDYKPFGFPISLNVIAIK